MTDALPSSIECLLEELENPHPKSVDEESTILGWTNALGVENKCVCTRITIDPWAFSEAIMKHYEVPEGDVDETVNRIQTALGGWGVSTNGSTCDYCQNLMEKDKPLLDLSPLERAITQLEGSLDLVGEEESNPRLFPYLRAGAIQAFEFTWELTFRMLRRHIELTADSPAQIDMTEFNPIIREAFRRGLVQAELKVWREYRDNRNITSHTYNEDKAQEVLDGIPGFLQEARYLLNRLRERNQSS